MARGPTGGWCQVGEGYSQPNVERLLWVDQRKLIHPKVRPKVAHVLKQKFAAWAKRDHIGNSLGIIYHRAIYIGLYTYIP